VRPRVLLGGPVIVLVLLAGITGAIAEELTCVFNVTREVVQSAARGAPGVGQPAAAGPRRAKETRRTMIGLAKDSITVTHEGETTLAYYFPTRRMYVLDVREKTYADLSLYGTVASRVNELVRRREMENGFVAARVAQGEAAPDGADEFTAESLTSRRLPGDAGRPDAPVATVVHRGKEWDFDRGGRRFVWFVQSDHPVPPKYRRTWIRFLVHQCSIHPTIREQIVRTGAIPGILEFSYFDGTTSCAVSYRLESVGEDPRQWTGVPAGFAPKLVPGDRLGRILTKLDGMDREHTLRTQSASERFVADALARGNALDAYLGWAEYAALGPEDAENRASKAAMLAKIRAARDGRVSSLVLRQEKPEELQAMLTATAGIDRHGLKKGYQLDVSRAFLLGHLGRVREADGCLLEALEANPHLLNCYRQLGDDHLRAFDTVDAWRCYDGIRRVDPHSDLLKDVKELEARLEKDFPDDF
jgi:hypothetical protein